MKNGATLIVTLVIFLSLILACGVGGGKPAPTKYQGSWVGTDGSTVYMKSDGTAGFVVGSKKVTGGAAEIDETARTITISLFFLSHTFKIDEEPNERGEMKLNGIIFRKRG